MSDDEADVLRRRLLMSRKELNEARAWMRQARAALEGFQVAAQEAFGGGPRTVIEDRIVRIARVLHALAERCPLPKGDDDGAA